MPRKVTTREGREDAGCMLRKMRDEGLEGAWQRSVGPGEGVWCAGMNAMSTPRQSEIKHRGSVRVSKVNTEAVQAPTSTSPTPLGLKAAGSRGAPPRVALLFLSI
eukprot:3288672-Rhodomonas_salina.1